MFRVPARTTHVLIGLGFLAEVALLWIAGRGSSAPAPTLPWLMFGIGLGIATLVAGARSRDQERTSGRLTAPFIVVLILCQIVVAVSTLLPIQRPDPRQRDRDLEERIQEELVQRASVVQPLSRALVEYAAACAAAAPADSSLRAGPYAPTAAWARGWERSFDGSRDFPLATVLWLGDQRVGWSAGGTLTAPPATVDVSAIVRAGDGWLMRRVVALPSAPGWRLEMQVRLVGSGTGLPGAPRASPYGVTREIVVASGETVAAEGEAVWASRRARDVVLLASGEEQASVSLRFQAPIPAASARTDRLAAIRYLLLLGLVAVSVVLWTAQVFGALAAVLALWLVRTLWAAVDGVRWVAAASPGPQLPAGPGDLISLLDPAYFATTAAGGLLASGADALITGAVAATTALVLWRRLQAGGGPRRPLRPWRLFGAAIVLGGLVGLALLGLRAAGQELVVNANARLIGLQVPVNSWTFWALHAALLAGSVAVIVTLTGLAAWLLRPISESRRGVFAIAAMAAGTLTVWIAAAPAGVVMTLVAGGLAALVGELGRRRSRPGRVGRLVWLGAGLLATVVWNYIVLAQSYQTGERDWLRRKAEQIVRPQDDWIVFLLDDVLVEMAAVHDTVDGAPARTGGRGKLWQDLAAHRLWRGSAIRDLGLPCLVEILDADGRAESLYAAGFLRDFTYEVIERSEWWRLTESVVAPGTPPGSESGAVLLQEETRRYPTGRERILRGEVPRAGDAGWLRVELPVQSRRLSTLLMQLGGRDPTPPVDGYRPRREVDRPVMLLRGDRSGWLDVGAGGVPAEESARAIGALKSGRREWDVVKRDGSNWLCRWAALPPEQALGPGEGFLLGLEEPGVLGTVLDGARLVLLDVLMVLTASGVWRLARRRWRWELGFQGRFLAGYLGIGLVLLGLAGWLADRLTFERLEREARDRTRDGLVVAVEQLRGLLAEQARAFAASDYISDLLEGRLAGERPQGPYAARQGMVFAPDGSLVLDETLSDLDPAEAALLLENARSSPLVLVDHGRDLFLGTLIPIDLPGLDGQTVARRGEEHGAFYYRQRLDDTLLASLSDIVGGELMLRLDGEAVTASHPGRLFTGEAPLLTRPAAMRWFLNYPGVAFLAPESSGLVFHGGTALPALTLDPQEGLVRRVLPAVLSVDFPDRSREFAFQRRQTFLFLAGLATLLLLTALGLATVMTWSIFEPLRVLLGATQRLADGDFAAPLPPSGRDEVGRLAGGFGAMRDELREARDRLAARERFLSTVLERVPVGVLVWTDQGELVTANPAARDILAGFSPGDDAGAPARLRQALAAAPGQGETELSSTDGRRTVRVRRATLELGGSRPHLLAVCEDLTAFLAARKQALNAELARQVAHEIKNPLTPIQLSAQLLQQAYHDRSPRLDAIVDDAIARILEQVTLLRSIAGEFSLLGRPGELDCVALDPEALVRDVVAAYSSPAGDGHGRPWVAVAPGSIPAARGHRESLIKVLNNLMQNSLDAAGGPENLEIAISWQVEPDAVTLVWEDNGPGIPRDVADRLFDPYFSTKSKGTGLGLAICRNLLDKMGGRIDLANRQHAAGAVATVTLPRAEPVPDRSNSRSPATGDGES